MTEDRLSATFAALADPVRRAILTRLADGDATVNELAGPFEISPQAVSKHLKVLERAGLITRERDGQRRPCRLQTEPLISSAMWMEHHRRSVEARLDRLGDLLAELQDTEPQNTEPNTGKNTDNGSER